MAADTSNFASVANMDGGIRAEIEQTLGSEVLEAESAAWGFKNQTWDVVLADGSAVVVQLFRERDSAIHRITAMRQLGALSDLPIPRVLAANLDAPDPWAVYVRLEGQPGYERAGWDLSDRGWVSMAGAMGAAVYRIQIIPTDRTDLPDLWSRVDDLCVAARQWVEPLKPYLRRESSGKIDRVIGSTPTVLGDFFPVVAHGDFGPQNALFVGTTLTGIVDLEDARLAHPLLDAAWWNWLVRAHTPNAFARSWRSFLQGARADDTAPRLNDQMQVLTVLRLLEAAESFGRISPEKQPSWATRIEKQLEAMKSS